MGSDVRQSIRSSAIDPHCEQQRDRPLWKITKHEAALRTANEAQPIEASRFVWIKMKANATMRSKAAPNV